MSRLHDMGGRFGDGAVVPEPDEAPHFEADWHPRALALTLACGGLGRWNIDVSRHAREKLPPADYARFTYYEKWMGGLVDLLVEQGLVTRSELVAGTADDVVPLVENALVADKVASVLAQGGPADRPCDVAPAYAVGDAVRTRRAGNLKIAGGHTRLPTYAEAAEGRIVRYHGCHVFPDFSAHGLGDAPEPLYAVAFPASALWTHPEHPADEVVLDLWQSYLTPA